LAAADPGWSAEDLARRLPTLRDRLLDAQFELRTRKSFAVLLLVTGIPAAGRSESVNRLLEWLDPKLISVNALGRPDETERKRPLMWRYWQVLPSRGRVRILFGAWYNDYTRGLLVEPPRARRQERRSVERILRLEKMLHADAVRVVKIHLRVDRKTQRKRLRKLASDPLSRWRVTKEDRWLARHFDDVDRVAKRCIRLTHHAAAPWHVIEGRDSAYREYEVGRILLEALEQGLAQSSVPSAHSRAMRTGMRAATLSTSQPSRTLAEDEYEEDLERLQGRLALLVRKRRFQERSLVLAFEGMDAAGKGGAIRRVVHALDARHYRVIPVSAPSAEELVHPYLWRFWRHVPVQGRIAVFDRSWYGRVLVERVRGLTAEPDWRRAYAEIVEFEQELVESGAVVLKFWLAVSPAEQLRRFEERDANRLKRFKVDPADWDNRRYHGAYQLAAREMCARDDREDPRPIRAVDDRSRRRQALRPARGAADDLRRARAGPGQGVMIRG